MFLMELLPKLLKSIHLLWDWTRQAVHEERSQPSSPIRCPALLPPLHPHTSPFAWSVQPSHNASSYKGDWKSGSFRGWTTFDWGLWASVHEVFPASFASRKITFSCILSQLMTHIWASGPRASLKTESSCLRCFCCSHHRHCWMFFSSNRKRLFPSLFPSLFALYSLDVKQDP